MLFTRSSSAELFQLGQAGIPVLMLLMTRCQPNLRSLYLMT